MFLFTYILLQSLFWIFFTHLWHWHWFILVRSHRFYFFWANQWAFWMNHHHKKKNLSRLTTNGFTNKVHSGKFIALSVFKITRSHCGSLLCSQLWYWVQVLSIMTSWTSLSNFSNIEYYVPFHFWELFQFFPHRSWVQRWYFSSGSFFPHRSLSHPQNSSAELSSAIVELYNSHIDRYLPKAYCNHFTTDRVIGRHTLWHSP